MLTLTRWLLGALGWVLHVMGHAMAIRVGHGMGWFLWAVLRWRRKVALDNLRHVFADRTEEQRREIALNCCKHFGRMTCEVLMQPYWTMEQIGQMVTVEGADRLHQAVQKGKGVILFFGHMGNWELCLHPLKRPEYRVALVSKFIKGAVGELLHSERKRSVEELHTKGTFDACVERLEQGWVLGVIIDQHYARERAVMVKFLGRTAACAPSTALLALRTGAEVMNVAVRTTPTGYAVSIGGPHPVPTEGDETQRIQQFTQQLQDVMGEVVLKQPECWLWLHRRWKAAKAEETQVAPAKPPVAVEQ